jgi:membrane-bound lytic murein transglycosylase MltF
MNPRLQVIPKNAAASSINIPNVMTADKNIEAGVKMLRDIEDRYFNDPSLNPVDKTLMVFASYNAGPNRIARLRKEAANNGLDPNKWFGNVTHGGQRRRARNGQLRQQYLQILHCVQADTERPASATEGRTG